MLRILFTLLLLSTPVQAEGERAGDFDYYVLALSWSPNWCTLKGDAQKSDQCDARHDHGWILHGLWPQYERGYPSNCKTAHRPPSRTLTAGMADIMGTSGLAWHQWNKHGTCTNLSAQNYYRLSRLAYEKINRPSVLRKLNRTVRLPAKVIEEAFMESNPKLLQNQITITCKSNHIQETRICLTPDLKLRKCGSDVLRDCTAPKAILTPIR